MFLRSISGTSIWKNISASKESTLVSGSAEQNTTTEPPSNDKAYWEDIKDETTRVNFSNVVDAILGPPEPDRIFEGINALAYTRGQASKIYDNRRALPGKLISDPDLLRGKTTEESYPCKLVQVSNLDQYIVIDDEIYCVTGCSVNGLNDGEPFYEVRIKFDHGKEITDPKQIKAIKSLLWLFPKDAKI